MSMPLRAKAVTSAISTIEGVSSRIEEIFAKAGDQLGRGHLIFQGLNQSLATLSEEFSGAQIEGTSQALHDIAGRLTGLAEALPAEGALLGDLGKAATEASELLKPLFKHIQMISIIARSAKIEAASLAQDREGFLAFTQEAYELAMTVQQSLEACARDQDRLAKAIETALNRHKDFEQHYQGQLLSEGRDLISAYTGMQDQRNRSTHLAALASSSTKKIAEAVGRSIVSMQAGDSTRQRLEHVCHGLALTGNSARGIAPDAGVVCRLQAMQLKDAERELQNDLGEIMRAMSAILADASGVVGQGRSLYGGSSSDSSSFLARIRQILTHASTLIATCETSGKSVDDALMLVEDTLGNFRGAIASLSEAVVDITLIGMNASLKAGHLGSKDNAFVVIANELKATADQVSAGVARLRPTLDGIETSANGLRALRAQGDPAQLAKLEPQVLHVLHEMEAGNERLGILITRLINEGAEFEGLMSSAASLMTELGNGAAPLREVILRLDAAGSSAKSSLAASDEAGLDDLFERYTMERERDVHRDFLRGFGITLQAPAKPVAQVEEDDGVLLF